MHYLRTAHPVVQLMTFLGFALLCSFVFVAAGTGLVKLLYGIDGFVGSGAYEDLSNPDVVASLKVLMVFNHLGLFIAPAIIFPKLMRMKVKDYLLLDRKPTGFGLGMGVLTLFFFFFIANYVIWLNEQLVLPESWGDLETYIRDQEDLRADQMSAFQSGGISSLLVNLVMVALLPAIGEELVFRGIVQKLMARATKNIHWGIWISAALFSLMHWQFYGFLPRMLYGALFGYILIWSGSIWVPILMHFANNAGALILGYLAANQTVPENADSVGGGGEWGILITSSVLFLAVVWFFSKRSKWSEIKYSYLRY